MLTCKIYTLSVFVFLDGVVSMKKEERKTRHGLDMYSFYTCSPWPFCQKVLCMLRPSRCIRFVPNVGHNFTDVNLAQLLLCFHQCEGKKNTLRTASLDMRDHPS